VAALGPWTSAAAATNRQVHPPGLHIRVEHRNKTPVIEPTLRAEPAGAHAGRHRGELRTQTGGIPTPRGELSQRLDRLRVLTNRRFHVASRPQLRHDNRADPTDRRIHDRLLPQTYRYDGRSPRSRLTGGVNRFGRRFPRRSGKSEEGAYVRVEE